MVMFRCLIWNVSGQSLSLSLPTIVLIGVAVSRPLSQTAGDYEDDDGGLDDGDMIQLSGKGKGKASYQVDYTPLSPKDLENEMKKEISHVAGALSLKVRMSNNGHADPALDCYAHTVFSNTGQRCSCSITLYEME